MSTQKGHRTTTPALWLTGLIVVLVATTAIFSGGALPAKAAAGDATFTLSSATYSVTEGGNVPIVVSRTVPAIAGPATATLTFTCAVVQDCGGSSPLIVNMPFSGSSTAPDAPYASGYSYVPFNDPLNGTRSVSVVLTVSAGSTTAPPSSAVITVKNGSPTITSVAPPSGPAAGGTPVVITGTNLNDVTTVTFAGSPATGFSVVNGTTINATTPAGPAGLADVRAYAGIFVSPMNNAYTYTGGAPTVTSLSPTSGSYLGGTTVTVGGTNFVTNQTTVTFGGVAGINVIVTNPQTLTVTSPAGTNGATVEVRVTVNSVTSAENGTLDDYLYTAATAPPTVTNVSPPSGSPGTTVTLTGTNYLTGAGQTSVFFTGTFGTQQATNVLVAVGGLSLTATAPNGTGVATVYVVTLNGSSPTTSTGVNQFTFNAVASTVTVTSVSPAQTAVGTTPTVTITGTGFLSSQTTVMFGSFAGTSVFVSSANLLTVIVPNSATPGRVEVRVTVGSVTSPENGGLDDFTYTNASTPTVTLLSPNTGPVGSSVVITGTNFVAGGTTATFSGVTATVTSSTTTTSLTVTVPSGTGTVEVVVTTGVGGSSPENAAFDDFTYTGTVTGQPTIVSISPNTCPTSGTGNVITINGTNFVATGMTVSFGGTIVSSYTFISVGQITAVCPAHNAGTVDITVTSGGLTSPTSAADQIIYTGANPVPTISSVSPSSGTAGTVVTVTGSCFLGATSVTFGGVAGTSLTVGSDASLTVTVPTNTAAAGTAVDVLIVACNGQTSASGTTNGRFTYSGTAFGATVIYTLYFRWTLIAWEGVDGASVASVLKGMESPVDDPATNDVSAFVTAIWYWDASIQDYKGNFPSAANIPGANQFQVMVKGQAYWFAVTVTTTWTTHRGN